MTYIRISNTEIRIKSRMTKTRNVARKAGRIPSLGFRHLDFGFLGGAFPSDHAEDSLFRVVRNQLHTLAFGKRRLASIHTAGDLIQLALGIANARQAKLFVDCKNRFAHRSKKFMPAARRGLTRRQPSRDQPAHEPGEKDASQKSQR